MCDAEQARARSLVIKGTSPCGRHVGPRNVSLRTSLAVAAVSSDASASAPYPSRPRRGTLASASSRAPPPAVAAAVPLVCREERVLHITCGCGTPGCPGVVTLEATADHDTEGSCRTCGEGWVLTQGALVAKDGILVSEARGLRGWPVHDQGELSIQRCLLPATAHAPATDPRRHDRRLPHRRRVDPRRVAHEHDETARGLAVTDADERVEWRQPRSIARRFSFPVTPKGSGSTRSPSWTGSCAPCSRPGGTSPTTTAVGRLTPVVDDWSG